MPTNKPATTIVLESQEMADRIEDFRFNHRFPNRSAAILAIIRAGMEALSDEYPELKMSSKPVHDIQKKEKDALLKAPANP